MRVLSSTQSKYYTMRKITGIFSPIEQSINNLKENKMGTFVYLLVLYSVVATLKIIYLKK